MKDRVHLPCWWKLEFVGGGGDDLFYFKRSLPFGCNFPRWVVESEVFVIQPYLIPCFPGCKAGINAVLHEKGSFFMGSNGFLPGFRKKVEAFF